MPDESAAPAIESRQTPKSIWSRLGARVRFRSQSYRRLRSSVKVFRKELDVLAGTAGEPWVDAARDLLSEAELALDDNEPERGWQSFFAAQRIALQGLTKEQVAAKARLVLAEAESKLKGWRKQAVQGQLAKAEPDVFALALAQQTLHEHYTNEYEKLRAIRKQTSQLCLIALAALLAILSPPAASLKIQGSMVLYGVLGAAFSGVLSLANASEKRIPQLLLHFSATMARVSLGAVAAYVIFTFLQAGILPFNHQGQDTVLALAFVAGFSERLLVSAVEAASR